jgi:hypothetical protein
MGIKCSKLLFVALVLALALVVLQGQTRDIRDLIQRADDAENDGERLRLLRQMQQQQDLEESSRKDLDKITQEIERWKCHYIVCIGGELTYWPSP